MWALGGMQADATRSFSGKHTRLQLTLAEQACVAVRRSFRRPSGASLAGPVINCALVVLLFLAGGSWAGHWARAVGGGRAGT